MDVVGLLGEERAGVPPAKMKRKGVDDMADDFSEFSLSSPARKMRRLDLRLPTILEGEESPIHQVVAPSQSSGEQLPVTIEAGASFPRNDERVIVLYKPVLSPQRLPNSFDISFKMVPNWVSEFKSRIFRSDYSNLVANSEEKSSLNAREEKSSNTCLAVVPWSPSQFPEAANRMEEVANASSEEMDVEDDASMDVEEPQLMTGLSFMVMGPVGVDQAQQQWQQHCIDPLVTTTNPTPVMWSR